MEQPKQLLPSRVSLDPQHISSGSSTHSTANSTHSTASAASAASLSPIPISKISQVARSAGTSITVDSTNLPDKTPVPITSSPSSPSSSEASFEQKSESEGSSGVNMVPTLGASGATATADVAVAVVTRENSRVGDSEISPAKETTEGGNEGKDSKQDIDMVCSLESKFDAVIVPASNASNAANSFNATNAANAANAANATHDGMNGMGGMVRMDGMDGMEQFDVTFHTQTLGMTLKQTERNGRRYVAVAALKTPKTPQPQSGEGGKVKKVRAGGEVREVSEVRVGDIIAGVNGIFFPPVRTKEDFNGVRAKLIHSPRPVVVNFWREKASATPSIPAAPATPSIPAIPSMTPSAPAPPKIPTIATTHQDKAHNANKALWELRFQQLHQFKLQHGHLMIPPTLPDLYYWAMHQQTLWRNGQLPSHLVMRLQVEGLIPRPPPNTTDASKGSNGSKGCKPSKPRKPSKSEQKWQENYLYLREFHTKKGHINVPSGYKPNPYLRGLRDWMKYQQSLWGAGKLAEDKVQKLMAVGMTKEVKINSEGIREFKSVPSNGNTADTTTITINAANAAAAAPSAISSLSHVSSVTHSTQQVPQPVKSRMPSMTRPNDLQHFDAPPPAAAAGLVSVKNYAPTASGKTQLPQMQYDPIAVDSSEEDVPIASLSPQSAAVAPTAPAAIPMAKQAHKPKAQSEEIMWHSLFLELQSFIQENGHIQFGKHYSKRSGKYSSRKGGSKNGRLERWFSTQKKQWVEGTLDPAYIQKFTGLGLALVDPAAAQNTKMAAKAKQAAEDARRSDRKRKATTMVIDGHTVKTSNNYSFNAVRYEYGEYKEDQPKESKKPKKIVILKNAKPVAARQQAAHVGEKLQHNAIVRKRMETDVQKRLNFMSKNVKALEPFVDRKVMATLQRNTQTGKYEPEKKGVLAAQPDCVTTTLRDYQMVGLDWMVKMFDRGLSFILGDEMGLGKTLQTISLIAHLKETKNISGPTLVICPLSVVYSWCNEVKKHASSLTHFRFHASDPKDREQQKITLMRDALKYDVIVTTYEMVKNPDIKSLINSTYFNLCVLDEGHVIKGLETQIAQAVRKIHSQARVILTGTPLQNNLVELYALLNYLYPEYFTTSQPFEDAFDITHNRINPDMLLKANKVLQLVMIRRLKQEVEALMPKKIETKVLCPLSSSQVFWYKGFLMKEIESLVKLTEAEEDENDENKHRSSMLRNLVMQLRKVSLHPYLFDFAEPDLKNTSVDELIATSGKLAVLDKLLISLFKNGHRTCIFSQFTTMLNILEDYCNLRGWKYCRFDGGTPRAQRNHLINQFNAPGSTDFIFLMSTKSGGLGINLQTADTCILYDSDWNPQPDLQAMARVHRIGQKKTVHVYRLLSAGTVEERVLERQEKKLYLDQMVNRGTSNRQVDEEENISASELLATLKFGCNAVLSSSNDLPTDNDIAFLTDRKRSEEASDGRLKGGVSKTASDFDKDKELTDTRNFCGMDFRQLLNEKESKNGPKYKYLDKLKQDWKLIQSGDDLDGFGKGKRDRKSRIVQLAGTGSGYGTETVPVLAMNNYDLQNGEPSVWRETKKPKSIGMEATKKKKTISFMNQDFCQTCGDGGEIIECPQCPVSVHSKCCGLKPKDFQSCSHHRCYHCLKTAVGAGGLLYRCQSCVAAYCGDCLPSSDEVRFLGTNIPRFEKLGYVGHDQYHYIHCSKQCENVAIAEFGFSEDAAKPQCPENIDVTYAFGKDALSVGDLYKRFNKKNNFDQKEDPQLQASVRDAGSAAASGPVWSGGPPAIASNPSPAQASTTNRHKFEQKWLDNYQLLIQFKQTHGHMNVPRSFRPIPGLRRLKDWIYWQQKLWVEGKQTEERIQMLLDVGMTKTDFYGDSVGESCGGNVSECAAPHSLDPDQVVSVGSHQNLQPYDAPHQPHTASNASNFVDLT